MRSTLPGDAQCRADEQDHDDGDPEHLQGKKSAKQALDDAAAEWNKILAASASGTIWIREGAPWWRPDIDWRAMPSLRRRYRQEILAGSFLWPSLLVLAALLIYPLGDVIRLSFYDSKLRRRTWVGLGNYQTLLNDPLFWKAPRRR